MKHLNKKIIISLLAVLLIFSACSGKDESNPEMIALRNAIKEMPTSASEVSFTQDTVCSDEAMKKLNASLGELHDKSASASFMMVDVDTGKGLSYNADWKFCSQSTIKAIYVGSLLAAKPEVFNDERSYNLIKKIITVSNNKAYEQLREMYGEEYITGWCNKVGIDESIAHQLYPRNITARDLAMLWTELYDYLQSKAPTEFVDWFYGTKYSAIYNVLGDKYKVHTKSGWENGVGNGNNIHTTKPYPPEYTDGDPLNDETATNDTGVIYSDNGNYIMVVLTNIPTNPYRLEKIVEAIDDVHTSICDKK